MRTEPRPDPEQDYDNASRASTAEEVGGGIADEDTTPGSGDTGSTHPEADPTGDVGDYSAADDPDRG
jgi:hypothetical protein